MFHPVAGALVQNFFEVLGKISRKALPASASALPREVFRGVHSSDLRQPAGKRRLVMAAGNVKQLLAPGARSRKTLISSSVVFA
jgi:hypothetical protein